MKKMICLINIIIGTIIYIWIENDRLFVHCSDLPELQGQVELLYLIILNLALLNILDISPKLSLVISVLTILLFPFTGGQVRVGSCRYYLIIEDMFRMYIIPDDLTFLIAYRLIPLIIYSMYLLLLIIGVSTVMRKKHLHIQNSLDNFQTPITKSRDYYLKLMRKKNCLINIITATIMFIWMKTQVAFLELHDKPDLYGQLFLFYLIILNLAILANFDILPKLSLGISILTIVIFLFTGGRSRVDSCSCFLVIESITRVKLTSSDVAFKIVYDIVPSITICISLLLFIIGISTVFKKLRLKRAYSQQSEL